MIKKGKENSRLLFIMVVALLGCMLMVWPALAEGTGDGSGGGKSIPLGLDSSNPADGQKDVPVTGEIKLTFNKNVIYLLIRDANKKCISLTTADGSKVPIEVIMADDQTPEGFEQRRNISVKPVQKLQPGTAYVVKVSPEFQAKNGMSLGKEVTVKFVTAGTAPQPVKPDAGAGSGKTQPENIQPATPVENPAPGNESLQPASQPGKTAEEKVQAPEVQAPAEQKVQTAEEKIKAEQPQSGAVAEKSTNSEANRDASSSDRTVAIVAGLVLIAAAGYYGKTRRK